MTATPLDSPPLTGRQLTDYRDMPGYAILPREMPEQDEETRAMSEPIRKPPTPIRKPPTPQGISALLRKAGFGRSEYSHPYGFAGGYRVQKDRSNDKAVRVSYLFGVVMPRDSAGRVVDKLAEYAAAITEAGWTVKSGDYELIVTAGKD
jgi:hypothetical protein